MNARNIIWWVAFLVVSICLQQLLPGLDVLVIGLIIALQEGKPIQLLWVLPVLILMQEGMGTLAFGTSLLWYAVVIVLFHVGRWLFEAENFYFVFLLSACLGTVHFFLIQMMASLQDIVLPIADLRDESILQALFIPFAWRLAHLVRKGALPHEDPV